MKTLNRPMFRYGGPIKEGVMNGIREPKRNGGSMGNNEGPRRAALVGNNIFPKTDGRENHLIQFPIGAAVMTGIGAAARAGARYIPRGINYLKNLGRTRTGSTTSTVPKQGPTFPGRTTTTQGGFGAPVTTRTGTSVGPGSATIETPTYAPNILGRYPLVRLGGKIISGVTNPAVTGKLASAARFVISPSGAVIGGLYYANGKFFNKNNEEVNPPKGDIKLGGKVGKSGAPGGGDPDMTYTAPEKELSQEEIKAAEAKARMEKMDSYKEIMNIKGMSKDAAYKSLIDASQIIADNGNLKEGIKDGSLIARLTGAASKRFDKVSDTEAALRSLIAKGEITKDMNKDENALAKLLKQKQIEIADKSLAGKSMAEIISTRMEKGDMFQGSELASLLRVKKGIDAKVLPSGQMEQGQDPLDYITSVVATVNADETTPDYPDGVYVIKDRIIQVMDGQVIPVSINQLT